MQNMTKRLLCLVMTVILVLSMIPAVFATEAAADAVAVNTTTGVQYASLADALLEAADGQTIQLQQDAEDTITTVFENVTLDLNGNTLTTDYMTCFGDLVDTGADNAGLLCVSAERFMLQETNSQLPVKTAEGYRFAELSGFNTALVNETKYVFQPLFEAASHEALAQGKAVTGVSVQVYVSWQQGEGTRYQTFSFNDSHLQGFLASYKAASNKYSKQFALSLLGAENFEGLQFAARIVSDTGVVFGAKADSILPEGSVEVDEENKLVGDTTLESAHGTAYVAAGTKLNEGVTTLTLATTPLTDNGDLEIAENEQLTSLDVHVEGIAADNTVPVIVTVTDLAPEFLNQGNLTLYHEENGENVPMIRVMDLAEVDAHNEYYYDVATGTITMALVSFSPMRAVADTTNAWGGNRDYTWYKQDATELTIYNADQLAGFGAIVGGMDGQTEDSFAGKTVKLMADINIGDTVADNGKVFYPIGYYNNEETYEKSGEDIDSWFKPFKGTFDGNGHTISSFYQNTWEMKGDHEWYAAADQHYRDGMGLFGKVYGGTVKNLTIDNFKSDGEITTTGCVAAYADCGATFENIAITNCNPRVYNIGNGGIVGCVGWYAAEAVKAPVTFRNITVDKTNKISALWGTYDVACGGIVGQYYPTSGQTGSPANAGIHFDNCHVAAQIDVHNDVCANYQYYAYRYSGMLIGSVRENVTGEDGRVYPKMDGITASACTVEYGDWVNYYYCELVANSLASYTHDHQFSRLTQVKEVNGTTITYLDGTQETVPASGRYNFVVVNGEHSTSNATCYHFVDGQVWNHEDAGYEDFDLNGDGELNDYKEDRRHYFLPFTNQLVTGYGWGVTSKGIEDFEGTDIHVSEGNPVSSVAKFQAAGVTQVLAGKTYTVGELFAKVENVGVGVVARALSVFASPVEENGNVSVKFDRNDTDWTQGTVTFYGSGEATVTINDYFFCTPTTITVNVEEFNAEPGMYAHATDIDNGQYVILAKYDGQYFALNTEIGDEAKISYQLVEVINDVVKTKDAPSWNITVQDGKLILQNADGYLYNKKDTDLSVDSNEKTEWTLATSYTINEETDNAADGAYYLIAESGTHGVTYRNASSFMYFRCINLQNISNTATASSYCFDLYFYKLIVCEHDWVVTETVEADCTTNGSVTSVCSKCSEEKVEETAALGHSWGESVQTKAPTCVETGTMTATCSVCNATETVEIPATGHQNTTTTTVNATCTATGSVTVTCDDCGATVSTETIPATGEHTYVDGVCSVCGDIDAAASAAWKLVTDASQLTAGTQVIIVAADAQYAYAMGSAEKDNNRPAVAITKNSSNDRVSAGDDVQVFTLVDGTVKGTFAFFNGEKYLYASSSSNNYLTFQTTNDDNTSWLIAIADGVASVVAQGDHTRNYMQFNLNKGGSPLFACYAVDKPQEAISLYMLNCDHSNTVAVDAKAATCTEAGNEAGTKCADCGTIIAGCAVIAPLGHSCGEGVVTAPTCVDAGYTTYTCSVCGYSYTEEGDPATGEHNYVDGTCSVCGKEEAVEDITISFSVPSDVAEVPSQSSDVALPAAADFTANGKKYTFAGWTNAAIKETARQSAAPAVFYKAGDALTDLTENTTLIALYTVADSSTTDSWTDKAITEIKASDVVVIVGNNGSNYAMSNDNGTGSAPAAVAVTFNGDQFSGTIADNIKWNIVATDDGYIIYPNGDTTKWLYCTNTNNGVRVGTNTNNVFTLDASSDYLKHTGTGRYLGIYNSQDWRCYTASTATNINGQSFKFYVNSPAMIYVTQPCDHEDATVKTEAATCTENGSKTTSCTCGYEKVEVLEATGHTYVDGTCSVCGVTESTGSEPAEPTVVLEITKDDFNTTSYTANNNTKTEGNYSYTSYQVMQQSSVIQWQKGKGYITIASNDFIKLELKVTEGTFTVTVGGKTVTGTTANGVTTYDLTGLTGEIKISVGSKLGKVDYIKFYK